MSTPVESRLRSFLLVVTIFIFAGTLVELVLETHTKETLQWIPFFLCAAGAIVAALVLRNPQPSTIKALRAVMVIVMLGSLLGIALHMIGNYTLVRDLHPQAAPFDIFMTSLKGADPLIAPGILFLAGTLSLAATYEHPALKSELTV